MSDIFKKTFLAGLGAMSLTREKAQEITNDLIKRGELAKTDEAKFVRDLLDLAEKNKSTLEEKIEKAIEKVVAKLDIPTRREIEELKAEISKLSKKSK
ncbi:MAG TPA: phasin family protein [Bacteroidales bacterium]|jgi:poly(hydroxyalkanoate) granule-associated protein|nr:phasin family protein [Bacteroidales bacterium]